MCTQKFRIFFKPFQFLTKTKAKESPKIQRCGGREEAKENSVN